MLLPELAVGPELQGSGPEVTEAVKGVKLKSVPGQDPAGLCGMKVCSSRLERLVWIWGCQRSPGHFCAPQKTLSDFSTEFLICGFGICLFHLDGMSLLCLAPCLCSTAEEAKVGANLTGFGIGSKTKMVVCVCVSVLLEELLGFGCQAPLESVQREVFAMGEACQLPPV